MIQRIVLVKLKDEHATDEIRAELAEKTRELLPKVPGVVSVEAGVPADDAARKSWDLSIVVSFRAIEDVAAYLPHPDHRAYVDELLRPKMEMIKAWSFATGSGG